MSKRFKAIFDFKQVSDIEECIYYDIGRFLTEQTVSFQLYLPPLAYERRYAEIYVHKQNNIIKVIIPSSGLVLEHLLKI
ncbi:MAG: hypothetical protein QXR45_14240 [Candidatus Bathyarchaeia archaeon]